jgi:hemerythrin-like domain-containing protein
MPRWGTCRRERSAILGSGLSADRIERTVTCRPAGLDERRRTGMHALTLLKQDHEAVKELLGKLDATTERGVKTREELFTKLVRDLEAHEAIEEEILYPALKEHPKAKDLVLEAYEEHHVVDTVMGELQETSFDDETWGAKLTVMKENLEHHIEEEESEMFDRARSVFDRGELEELGTRMEERKASLLASASPAG